MKALTPGKYGIIHAIEVTEEQLAALAVQLGIQKPGRLKAGKVLIVRELEAHEALDEPEKGGAPGPCG